MSLHRDHSFESCIKCTVCTTYCPVAKVNPLYPGPKQAGPDGERLRLKDPALYDEALKYCTNCKRCEVACPSDVKIGDIIQRARADFARASRRCAMPYSAIPISWDRCRRRLRRSSTPPPG